MLESISTAISSLSTAASTAQIFKELLKDKRGDVRALLEELKECDGLCRLVSEKGVDPLKVVPELPTTEYDRLLRAGFDFNVLNKRHRKVLKDPHLTDTNLDPYIGKEIAVLVEEGIYDRIKDLKLIYRVDKDNARVDWRRRIRNLHMRILLLLLHLRR
jgi:hypothetical protein